jgi:hypothetical protein
MKHIKKFNESWYGEKEEVFIDEIKIKEDLSDFDLDFNYIADDLIIINFTTYDMGGDISNIMYDKLLSYFNSIPNVQAQFIDKYTRQLELSTVDSEHFIFAY